ncbi:MAG: glycosyltransferase family 2 protein [Myxococcales bacterium]|nr:glycosyltransferase family 2 protein [Myxococcales bacterium]
MYRGRRIAVVVPAHEEERLIGRTLGAVPAFVDHVIVVDDGSADATSAQARALGDARVEVVRHEVNQGVGAAIVSGYRRAFAAGAEIAVVMAGDAQMDPRDLPALLDPVVEGRVGYAKGDRLAWPGARSRMPFSRWLGNHALSLLTRLATGLRLRDSQCGYTALARDAAARVPLAALWPRYGYPNDLLGMLARHGVAIEDVRVRPVYADEVSGVGLRHALVVIPSVLARVWWRRLIGRSEPSADRGAARLSAEASRSTDLAP